MSESGDYVPAPHWGGHDFASARRAYADKVVSAGPSIAAKLSVDAASLVPELLETDCESPLVIACDVTGSMQEWPATIFSKLPYLEHEGKEYLGKNMKICFAAIGDYHSDKYPLQVREFVEGAELKTNLEALINEQGGGGSSEESYDLAALYFAKCCNCPKAIRKPILIMIGDEGIYSFVDQEAAEEYCKMTVKKGELTPSKVFKDLQEKFAVYVIRKPYNCTTNNRSTREIAIHQQWVDLLGDDHVVSLPDPNRVVDVIFGILAKETGRVDYFKDELEGRQGKDTDGAHKIDVVLKSLRSIHENIDGPASLKKIGGPKGGRSVTKGKKSSSPKSKSLLDD